MDAQLPFRQANGKFVKQRIWINLVTSKIMKQLLESDTDAQLHEERGISVRNKPKLASQVLQENVPDEMRTSWKLFDVTKFQEGIKIAQKTAAIPYVP